MNATGIVGAAHIASSPGTSPAMPLRRQLMRHVLTVTGWLAWQIEKRRGRLALLEMSDDQLKDIGLSRSEAYGVATRRCED
jgi:uncharacterized protein YjiS (DUF1127 family)